MSINRIGASATVSIMECFIKCNYSNKQAMGGICRICSDPKQLGNPMIGVS